MRTPTATLIFAFLLWTGCSTPLVVPSSTHIPLLQKQWNTRLLAQLGSNGMSGSLAFSPLQNVALRGAYSRISSMEQRDYTGKLTDISHGHELKEAALGFYVPSFSVSDQNLTLEAYAGLTTGTMRGADHQSLFSSNVRIIDANARQVFIDLNIGFLKEYGQPKDTLREIQQSPTLYEFGSSFRFSKWILTDITYDGTLSPDEKKEGNYLQATIFGRIGGENLFFEGQVGTIYAVSDHPNRPSLSPLFVSFGVHLSFF